MRRSILGLAATLIALATAGNLQAAITSISFTPQTAGGVKGIVPPDNLDAVVYKDFNQAVGLGPVDLNVTVDAAGIYLIYEDFSPDPGIQDGFIHNFSGFDWTDFHFQLIGPSGSSFFGAIYDVFTHDVTMPTTIDLSAGTVPVGSDFHCTLNVYAGGPGTFTVREWATVPEPSALLLVVLGAASLLGYAWRRR